MWKSVSEYGRVARRVVFTAAGLILMGLRAFAAETKRIPVGGQAVIEGVLMRGDARWGLCVRNPEGNIWSTVWRGNPWSKRGLWRLPVFRGVATMAEMLAVGMKAISQSAEIALGEEETLTWKDLALSILLAIGGVVGLFLLLPMWLGDLWMEHLGGGLVIRHVVEGSARAAVFIGYVGILGLWGETRRFFAYHGAEHKTINAYEKDAPLTPDSVRTFSRIHPRCGTSFLLVVVMVSIVIFALVGNGPLWWKALSRILFLPVVIGVSYEFIKWADTSPRLGKALIAPALSLQYLTTREPDTAQIEVGIASLEVALGKKDPEHEGQSEAVENTEG